MDYFNDVRKLSDFIKNILICVPKMNLGLTSLDTRVSNDRTFIFGWIIPLDGTTSGCPSKLLCKEKKKNTVKMSK